MKIDKFMTPRLLAVASFVAPESRVADIGTDHAYIPIWLLEHGVSKSALAMDINKGPIDRANENILKFHLEDKIKTRLSNGLENLKEGEADTIVIAGMGGILINEILKEAKEKHFGIKHFILQPMTAIEETRKFLEENGFCILNERLAKEDEKLYCVLLVSRGEMKIDREIDYYIGQKLIENKDPLLLDYLNGKLYEYEKAISLLKQGDCAKNAERLSHFTFLVEEMKKLKERCITW